MTDEPGVEITVQPDPLALLFELEDGRTATASLEVHAALAFVINFMSSPSVENAILLPRFVKRYILRALFRSWQQSRKRSYGLI